MKFLSDIKVGCAFPMVVSSDFRLGKHRDDGHEEDASTLNYLIKNYSYKDRWGKTNLFTSIY